MRDWQDLLKHVIVIAAEIIQKNYQEQEQEQPDIKLNLRAISRKSCQLLDGSYSSTNELEGTDQYNSKVSVLAHGFQFKSISNNRVKHDKKLVASWSDVDYIVYEFSGVSETDIDGVFVKDVQGKIVKGNGKYEGKTGRVEIITIDDKTRNTLFYFDK
jgi:hypothetical protein